MKSFAINSPTSRTHMAIVSPAADGSATVTIRDGWRSTDTMAIRICGSVEAAKAWAKDVLARGAFSACIRQ